MLRCGLRRLLLGRYLNGVSDKLYDSAEDLGVTVTLDMGACGYQDVKYFHQHSNDVDWVFVDHPSYHRAGESPTACQRCPKTPSCHCLSTKLL